MVTTITTISEIRRSVSEWRRAGKTIGFVPTMGFLHDGHCSLIRQASHQNDRCIVSIFVNPAQFGPNEDFERYPRDEAGDLQKASDSGADLVFLPTVTALYPEGYCTWVTVEGLSSILCGARRPGHFRGVTTIVLKLLHLVEADRLYLGQKDAQQAFILGKMVDDLHLPVKIIVMPIVRESDGLAMSSRNVYLTPDQRSAATILHRSLLHGRELFMSQKISPHSIRMSIEEMIRGEKNAVIDYIAILDPSNLSEPSEVPKSLLVALAVFFGKTRLIDNMIYEADGC